MFKRLAQIVVFAFAFAVLLTAAHASVTLEHKLASLNAKTMVASDHITVARFRSLLGQLDVFFVENQQQIGDMTVKAQELLRQEGIDETLLNIMEGMNQVFVGRVENQRYAEYSAAYITMRGSGQSHRQAISGLQTLMRKLGVR